MTRADCILRLLAWGAAIWIAYEFLWYEQYKLTGNEGSIDGIFQPLATWFGIPAHEKPLRLGTAIIEIVASVLVLVPRTRFLGAAIAFATMSSAIFFHTIGPIGIDPYGDGGQLFKEACFTWLMAALVLYAHREDGFALARRVGLPAPGGPRAA